MRLFKLIVRMDNDIIFLIVKSLVNTGVPDMPLSIIIDTEHFLVDKRQKFQSAQKLEGCVCDLGLLDHPIELVEEVFDSR